MEKDSESLIADTLKMRLKDLLVLFQPMIIDHCMESLEETEWIHLPILPGEQWKQMAQQI